MPTTPLGEQLAASIQAAKYKLTEVGMFKGLSILLTTSNKVAENGNIVARNGDYVVVSGDNLLPFSATHFQQRVASVNRPLVMLISSSLSAAAAAAATTKEDSTQT